MRLTSKSTKFKHLQSQLHKFLIKLITHVPYIITHVRDTYCVCGVYFEIIDEFLTWENLGELSYLLYNCLFYLYYHFMARHKRLCNNITRNIKITTFEFEIWVVTEILVLRISFTCANGIM